MILKELEYLYKKIPDYQITPYLSIKHPTYKEIVEYGEEKYVKLLYTLCTQPDDYKSELYDAGINWYEVDNINWFYMNVVGRADDLSIIFTNTNEIRFYNLYVNAKTDELVLYSPVLETTITSDRIKLIREHVNSMIGNMYKEHREIPKNNITRNLLIEEDRLNKSILKKRESSSLSIKDVIEYVLMNKFYKEDDEAIKSIINIDFHYKDFEMISTCGFRIGELHIINRIADEIYKDLTKRA